MSTPTTSTMELLRMILRRSGVLDAIADRQHAFTLEARTVAGARPTVVLQFDEEPTAPRPLVCKRHGGGMGGGNCGRWCDGWVSP